MSDDRVVDEADDRAMEGVEDRPETGVEERATEGVEERADDGADDSTEDVVTRLSPAEAFDLAGDETRLRIVRELNDADDPLSFGALRDRVGTDDPGRFNYHLQRLADHFVRQVEDGYRLAPPGRRVVGAVLSGVLTKAMDAEPVGVDGNCTLCGGSLVAAFEENNVRVHCPECTWVNTEPAVPPAILAEWDREAAPAAVGRWLNRLSLSAKLRLCPNCDGRLDRRLCRPGEPRAPDWFGGHVSVAVRVATCRHCGHWWHTIVEQAILVEPAVIAFHHDHDVDVLERPAWSLDWVEHDLAVLTGEDSLRVAVPVTLDDETRTFVVDRNCAVVDEFSGQPTPES